MAEADFSKRILTIDGVATPYDALGAWAALASLGGLPATVAPVGFTKGGLPLGMQIVGPYFEDRSTIALARLLTEDSSD